MKRYMMTTRKRYIEEDDTEMVECPEGGWVKYGDVKQIEELNREMVTTLKRVNEVIIEFQSGLTSEYLVEIIEPVLSKVKEVGK